MLGQNRALSLFHNSHKNVGYSTLAPWALKSSLPRWMKSCPLRKNLVAILLSVSTNLLLIAVWSTFFVGRIYLKEKSLQKKEGYDSYCKNSYLILFKFNFFNSSSVLSI